MYDIIRQFAEQLTLDEKKSLVSELRSAIARELAGGPGEPERCPRCGCPEFVRKGRASGSQRWLCRGCGRTFSSATRGLLAASKLPAGTWMEYAACMADALTLRECAGRCGVSLPTAWFMRMRLCEMMASSIEPFRAASSCQVDGIEFEESLSGNHSRSGFSMPRDPRRNGRDGRVRGISNGKVCAMTGINEYGDVFAEVCCRGRETSEEARRALAGRVGAGTAVTTDMHASYPAAIAALGAASHVRVDPKDPSTGDINMVNSMHSRIRGFMRRFNGVSTRRLQAYLDWFCWAEQVRAPGADRRAILFSRASDGRYEHSRRELFGMPHPFMGYWEAARAMSILV